MKENLKTIFMFLNVDLNVITEISQEVDMLKIFNSVCPQSVYKKLNYLIIVFRT